MMRNVVIDPVAYLQGSGEWIARVGISKQEAGKLRVITYYTRIRYFERHRLKKFGKLRR